MLDKSAISAKGVQAAGAVLFLWGIANTWVDISRYGLSSGVHWWFCNLALIGVGFGCLIKDRGFVVGFLAISLFTQIFWIVDDLSVLLFKQSTLGLAILRHAPNYPLDEFLLAQYHYFTIPIAFLGWGCADFKRGSAVARVALFNPLIFGVSYFLFSPAANINCIHSSCVPALPLSGPVYSVGFWLGIFIAHLAVAWGLERLRRSPLVNSDNGMRSVNLMVSLLLAFGALCSLYGMSSRFGS